MIKSDNRGFSLIELLVAIAIASIVGVAVFGFMITGARSFQRTSADVNVQHESQLVMNQIQDMLVDTNVGVEYTEDETQSVLTMYNYDAQDPNKRVYEVVYRPVDKRIFYNEYSPIASEDSGIRSVSKGSALYTEQLLGENIEHFSADLSALEKKRVVRIDLTVKRSSSDYSSSSNVTLRNAVKIGSTIPEYLEPTTTKDPLKVEGLDNFYFEPGREINLQTLGAYRVKMEDGSDYSDQDIRFFLSERGGAVSGTSISTSGILSISKAQKQDFYVMVTSRTGKGAPLEVKINLIIVDSVDITMTSYTKRSDQKTVIDATETVFEAGDTFTLHAEVKGRNLDKADVNMYGIKWATGVGSEAYLSVGGSSSSGKGSDCTFTMKDSYKVTNPNGQDPFTITATSVRSTQIPYFSGTKESPVVGTFQGFAHQATADFKISGKGQLLRGTHDTSFTVKIVTDLVNDIPGFDWEQHTAIGRLVVNEKKYRQEENAVSTTFDYTRNVTNSGIKATRERGATFGIMTPSAKESDPNCAYEIEVTFYIFEKHPGDSTNFQDLRSINPGETSVDGYDIADAKYQSNTVVQTTDRLFLFYDKIVKAKNEDGTEIYNDWVGNYTTKFYPRASKDHLNGQGWYSNETLDSIQVFDCCNVPDGDVRNAISEFRIYYPKDGKWKEYDESRRIIQGGDNYPKLTDFLTNIYIGGNSLYIRYRQDKWDDDFPQMVRLVPVIKYNDGSGDKEALLFDSYVETYLWNIEVPTIMDYQPGIKKELFDPTKYSRTYFPSPLDEWFLDLPKSEYKEWKYAYPMNVPNDKQWELQNINLSYKLSYNSDGYGNKTWYLHLKYYDKSQSKWINLGVYTCKDTEQNWTMIENSKVPDNLHFDF